MRFLASLLAIIFSCQLIFISQIKAQTANNPEQLQQKQAEQIIKDWLNGKYSTKSVDIGTQPVEYLRRTLLFPEFREKPKVNFSLVETQTLQNGQIIYSYPATIDDIDTTIKLKVQQIDNQLQPVSIKADSDQQNIPSWTTSPLAGWAFVIFSLLFLYFLFRKSWLQDTIKQAWQIFIQYRRGFIWTAIILYAVYVIGGIIGASDLRITAIIQESVSNNLEKTGIAANQSAGVLNTALGIFYNNFLFAGIWASFLPGILLGFLAYLFNFSQFFITGIALTPAAFPSSVYLAHVPTIIIELGAYITIVAAAGILAYRIFRQGLKDFRLIIRDYVKVLPLAALLLLIAAWYEAFEILFIIPALIK